MNSSNVGGMDPGFPNSNVPWLNARSFRGSSSGLSKPRFSKARKHTGSQQFRSNIGSQSYISDTGSNHFQHGLRDSNSIFYRRDLVGSVYGKPGKSAGEEFVFRANSSDLNSKLDSCAPEGVIDKLRELKVNDGKPLDAKAGDSVGDSGSNKTDVRDTNQRSSGSERTMASNLPEELRKLDIKTSGRNGSSNKAKESFFEFGVNSMAKLNSGKNGETKSTADSSEYELPNELENLNLSGSDENVRGKATLNCHNTAEFIFGNKHGSSHFVAEKSAAATLPNQIRNLNIKESLGTNAYSSSTDSCFKSRENILSNGINRLKITSNTKVEVKGTKPVIFGKCDNQDSAQQPINVTGLGGTTKFIFGHFHSDVHDSRVPSMDGFNFNNGCCFSSKQDIGLENFSTKREASKVSRLKKKKEKLRQAVDSHLQPRKIDVANESESQSNITFSEFYSPMEVSPYRETLADKQNFKESGQFDRTEASNDPVPVSGETISEDFVAATEHIVIDDGSERKYNETKVESCDCRSEKVTSTKKSFKESFSGADTESFVTANEQLDSNSDANEATSTFVKSDIGLSSKFVRQDIDSRIPFSFDSSAKDNGCSKFTFTSSSSAPYHASSSTRQNKKKFRRKVVHVSHNFTSDAKVPCASSAAASQEACEMWRLRGNQAYSNGDLSKAENCYSQGLECISQDETSDTCLRAMMLCYSNRAATRMSLGRMREALADCISAAAIDPGFLRVKFRTANCYLALGEVEDATEHFKKCLRSRTDHKIAVDASEEGLQKAHKVSNCISCADELLQHRTSDDAMTALGLITDALSISLYSEKLLEMKAESLLMLRNYEEVIQLCKETAASAEKNHVHKIANDISLKMDGCPSSFQFWRLCLSFRSKFHLGRLEEALEMVEKQERSGIERKALESTIPLVVTVRELLKHKALGNAAFQSESYAEAAEHYTTALMCSVESHPFSAICFCNRAAAHKALRQITDAIADCSLAIALNGNYLKAISRRATLFELIGDYEQAASDLQKLLYLLSEQVEKRSNEAAGVYDINQIQLHLSTLEDNALKENPLNLYLILGIEPSMTATDIKRAYRKAALRHHPDKALQYLARTENGDDRIWKEVAEAVHKDADKLFKMIGEAYAVLSDPTKRARYEMEVEMRSGGSKSKECNRDVPKYPSEHSENRRSWHNVKKSYYASSRQYRYV